jgi:hypothetical protein
MKRSLVAVVLASLTASACSADASGPSDPVPQEDLSRNEVIIQAATRKAAFDLVEAYADAASDDAQTLLHLVGSPNLRSWAHWVGVQGQQFPGTIAGIPNVSAMSAAAPVQLANVSDAGDLVRDVQMVARVDFQATPTQGDPVTFTRQLTGPMRLISDGKGNWRVSDFSRDGVPMSVVFQLMDDVVIDADDLRVELDSFVAAPTWQFNLVVTASGALVDLKEAEASIVDEAGGEVQQATDITSSLSEIRPGARVEGIVTFSALPSARGLSLRLDFSKVTGGGSDTIVEIPLSDVIRPILVVPPTAAPSPSG